MSSGIKDFVDAVKTENEEPTKVYEAIVSGVDDEGIVWVNIAGSGKETPTASTSTEVKTGDIVNVEWRNNKLYIAGNYSNPSAGSQRVDIIENTANKAVQDAQRASVAALSAETSAEQAQASASTAQTAAQQAVTDAAAADAKAVQAKQAADDAEAHAQTALTNAGLAQDAADAAQISAENASGYAARALGNLSTVQSVSETLTWITQHGTMTLTSDTALDPTHVYFVVDPNGDYTVGSTKYSVVTEPVTADMGTYYELSIDESLNNYVGTHLALDGEGLWLLPASSGTNKVLIATGAGSTYTTAGTYIIDSGGTVMASFRANGATINGGSGTLLAQMGFGQTDSGSGTTNSPFYTFGTRKGTVGSFSFVEGYGEASKPETHAEGYDTTASGLYAHAEGYKTTASGYYGSHAEGGSTTASGQYSHAEGNTTTSSGHMSHAEGGSTTASAQYGHTEGYQTTASGTYGSHAEGWNTAASGDWAHAEGRDTAASGNYAHAEGTSTTASANNAHAEGSNTTAGAANAHAQNLRTKASSASQTALGKYNVEDSADTYAVIVGNGTADNARSNALTVDWSGNVEAAGDIEDGTGNVLSDKADASAVPTKTSDLTNDSGFITTETDPTVPSWAKASSKPTYTASEVGALPDTTTIPTKTSDLTNDSGYITGYTETDPVFSASASAGISASDISNWNGKADSTGFFKIVELEVKTTAQIAAHGYKAGDTYTVASASRPSGMTLVGIVGWAASNYRLYASTAYVSGAHSIYATIANSSATSVSSGATITFRLLYIKATSA